MNLPVSRAQLNELKYHTSTFRKIAEGCEMEPNSDAIYLDSYFKTVNACAMSFLFVERLRQAKAAGYTLYPIISGFEDALSEVWGDAMPDGFGRLLDQMKDLADSSSVKFYSID